jgi:hypothetical protein
VANIQATAPFNIGIAITCSAVSSQYQVDVTLADVSGTYSAPPLTTFLSSFVGSIATSSANQIGAITTPVAAFRLTSNSSTISAVLTWIQSGIG